MAEPAGGTTTTERPPLPSYVTTPLLTRITESSLDEDYRHVADRKAADPTAPRSPHRLAAVVVAAFGVLVTIAAVRCGRERGDPPASAACRSAALCSATWR